MSEETKTFLVHYCFTIKDPKQEELAYWERDVMEVEAKSMKDIDTALIQQRIRQMAEDKIEGKNQEVIYANYHKIEKKRKKRKGK